MNGLLYVKEGQEERHSSIRWEPDMENEGTEVGTAGCVQRIRRRLANTECYRVGWVMGAWVQAEELSSDGTGGRSHWVPKKERQMGKWCLRIISL